MGGAALLLTEQPGVGPEPVLFGCGRPDLVDPDYGDAGPAPHEAVEARRHPPPAELADPGRHGRVAVEIARYAQHARWNGVDHDQVARAGPGSQPVGDGA